MTPATTIPTQAEPPKPEIIDAKIAAYELLEKRLNEAQDDLDSASAELIRLVQDHGVIPDGASQSKRLQGVRNSATVTVGFTRSLHEPSILKLREYLKKNSLVYLFRKLFEESTKYTLIDGARDVLGHVDLPKRTRETALALFGMCIDVKDRKPVLKITAVKAQKPRGGRKAAA